MFIKEKEAVLLRQPLIVNVFPKTPQQRILICREDLLKKR